MKNLTLVSQILNGSDPKRITTQLEGVLYAKADSYLHQVRLQEAAVLIAEADPKPAVWKDHEGKPLIPTKDEWVEYFENLAAEHVQAQLKAARERWSDAETKNDSAKQSTEHDKSEATVRAANLAQAELTALDMEIKAATSAIKNKKGGDIAMNK